jgi:hypothetical protein
MMDAEKRPPPEPDAAGYAAVDKLAELIWERVAAIPAFKAAAAPPPAPAAPPGPAEFDLERLAGMVAERVLGSPKLESLVKEMVLTVHLTTDRMSREGFVTTLLRSCRERGARVELSKVGGVVVHNGWRLTNALRDSIRVYRQDIIETLAAARRPAKSG